MFRGVISTLCFSCLCHSAGAACVDPDIVDGSASVVAIGGPADPAILALLAGFTASGEVPYPAREIPTGLLYFADPMVQVSRLDFISSVVISFNSSAPADAIAWLETMPDDDGRLARALVLWGEVNGTVAGTHALTPNVDLSERETIARAGLRGMRPSRGRVDGDGSSVLQPITTAIPEPGAVLFLGISFAGMLRRRR